MAFVYRSETIAEIVKALVSTQKLLNENALTKDKKGLRNTYATYENIAAHCQWAALQNDIYITQPFEIHDGNVYMCLSLKHISGEFLNSYDYLYPAGPSDWEFKSHNDEQQSKGGIKTYVGRYQLKHMFCLAIEDEDIDSKKNDDGQNRNQNYHIRYVDTQKKLISKQQANELRTLLANHENSQELTDDIRKTYKIQNLEMLEEKHYSSVLGLLVELGK